MISHFTIRLRKIYLDRYVCTIIRAILGIFRIISNYKASSNGIAGAVPGLVYISKRVIDMITSLQVIR